MDLRKVGHIGQDQATGEQDSDREDVPDVLLSLRFRIKRFLISFSTTLGADTHR
jgi:hypothetical protein